MENENKLIYLDYNATTPVDTRVVDAMLPYFFERPGNPGSHHHAYGWAAEDAVDQAREQLAGLLGVHPGEIIFTSGATESNNLAIKGIFQAYQRKGKHLITVKTEHKAVLDTYRAVEKMGGTITLLEVDAQGLINLEDLAKAIRPDTILVSIMWANNETGVIQPMQEIAEICTSKGTLLLSDATQAVGKIPVSPRELGIPLLSCSAHKIYGPKGVGALYISNRQPRVKVSPQIVGGGQENGLRAGTLNVPGIVGFGKAAAIAQTEMPTEAARLNQLRDQLEHALLALPEVYRNGALAPRLPQVSNVSFKYIKGEALMMAFKTALAVSSGSACTSANPDPSHVLLAMGLSENMAEAALRFSLGRFTTDEQIRRTITVVTEALQQVRAESPAWQLFQDGIDLGPMGWL